MVKKLVLHEIVVYAFVDQVDMVHHDAYKFLVGLFEDNHGICHDEPNSVIFSYIIFLKFTIHLKISNYILLKKM